MHPLIRRRDMGRWPSLPVPIQQPIVQVGKSGGRVFVVGRDWMGAEVRVRCMHAMTTQQRKIFWPLCCPANNTMENTEGAGLARQNAAHSPVQVETMCEAGK